ncbi:uncharacterized protein LOC128678104 [Plodia interpunctella]|uniref:uncharacterized protein LOC128678104 n=1 Tax=Plodia interpunctella TaxID=58824 RepID=UPI00236870A1|nr:uncharacterized protein LOC128678104 [Plodia interpunctella]
MARFELTHTLFHILAGAIAVSSLEATSSADTLSEQWEATSIVLPRGRPVNQTLGPETSVYCKLTDPTQRVVFEGHGRCNLVLDRVTNNHAGIWVMDVGLQGNMLTTTYRITALVRGTGDKPTVSTYVAKEQPEVTLKCSVPVEYEVKSCLFQDPTGRVIMSTEGASEDRYISSGSGTTVSGGVTMHECGLRITDPAVSDLGIWRCAVETEQDVYYGFLTVLCPWSMQDPDIAAAVVSEPTLSSTRTELVHMAGESMTLSCSIQSPIRYCYFRAPNGRTYSVSPASNTDEFEYVGAGLDSGECGIRFNRLLSQEEGHWPAGRWSCHVGLPDETEAEQRVNMQVQINRPIEVSQYLNSASDLVMEADVFQQQAVEYCRYVRIDGFGFTSATLPESRYSSTEQRARGHCGLHISGPTILDLHPWTIAAKIVGREEEVLDITNHSMNVPSEPETTASRNNVWIWCTATISGAILIAAAIMFIPSKNRARANSWKNSLRASLTKKPLPADSAPNSTPPAMSA